MLVKPFFARELLGERHHPRSEIGGGHAAGRTHFLSDRKRGITDATGEIKKRASQVEDARPPE